MSNTEKFWQKYKREVEDQKLENTSSFWAQMKKDMDRIYGEKNQKYPQELYGICKADNNYWRHIRAQPDVDDDSLAVLLCKDTACDLQYCMSMQEYSAKRPYAGIRHNGCVTQMQQFNQCMSIKRNHVRKMREEGEDVDVDSIIRNRENDILNDSSLDVAEAKKGEIFEKEKKIIQQ
eukprot:CAMPEP_0115045886 /NCGR_PEP_ID=MMETSP0216-20121206/48437_1 /TAXON_ID=223996 /ORGANISM="Protocruzia adherens, Strain Boccale" /LENGTH=176 /DNA_ID=CAMNT_0002428895 /DNA_START=11 /DNA_END=541 /DNA_ORIENTATION=-